MDLFSSALVFIFFYVERILFLFLSCWSVKVCSLSPMCIHNHSLKMDCGLNSFEISTIGSLRSFSCLILLLVSLCTRRTVESWDKEQREHVVQWNMKWERRKHKKGGGWSRIVHVISWESWASSFSLVLQLLLLPFSRWNGMEWRLQKQIQIGNLFTQQKFHIDFVYCCALKRKKNCWLFVSSCVWFTHTSLIQLIKYRRFMATTSLRIFFRWNWLRRLVLVRLSRVWWEIERCPSIRLTRNFKFSLLPQLMINWWSISCAWTSRYCPQTTNDVNS